MPKESRKVPARTVSKDSVVAALDNSVKMPATTQSSVNAQRNRTAPTSSQPSQKEKAQRKANDLPKAKVTDKSLAKSKDPNFIKTSVYFRKEQLNQLKIKKLQMNFDGDISDLVGEAVQKLIDAK